MSIKKSNYALILIFVLVAVMVTMSTSVFAQGSFTTNAQRTPLYPGEIIHTLAAIDSVGTLYTQAFNLRKYDGVYWGTNADTTTGTKQNWSFPFKIEYLATSVLGAPKLDVVVQGNFDADSTDAGWVDVDTIVSDFTTETLTKANLDLDNEKYPWYRLKLIGKDLGRADQTFELRQYCYQNDQN